MKPETMKERLFEGHFQCFPYNNKTVFKLQTTIYNDLSNISWKMTTELADGWKKNNQCNIYYLGNIDPFGDDKTPGHWSQSLLF